MTSPSFGMQPDVSSRAKILRFAARQLKPDLIIMDFVMPRMNGLQAARKLRTLEIHVPIILLTMYTEAVHGMPSFSVVNAVVAKTDAEELKHQACILLAL